MDILEQSLKKAFIDKSTGYHSHYDPAVIINKPDKKEFFLNTLQGELENSSQFLFSIAFITQDGLNSIKAQLADLHQKNVRGKLLSSTYLTFNHPDVFHSLLAIPNLDVRLSDKKGFHAKGYLFEKKDYHTLIVGSSNLTMSALKLNYEWNVRLTSYDNGEIIHQVKQHMLDEWDLGVPLSQEWIASYQETYHEHAQKNDLSSTTHISESTSHYIAPNKMQTHALDSLTAVRNNGAKKALVISATGTGKTYLSAFDVLQYKPKRMLFIVHREQILHAAKTSFKKIIGGPDSDYGILSGTYKETDAKYLFATIQTISKQSSQTLFTPDHFDYILIDEVHKAGADSYLSTLNYFQPDFLLGMTATPERTDHFNIFELFDYNVAYEIRLQDALEENMLCPFHYFGVTDYEKNGEVISETSDLKYLVNHERIDFLLEKINYYGCSKNTPKGLVFCSKVDEAKLLAEQFNERGIPSNYLSGNHSIKERENTIQKLEKGDLSYIFSVDIFNEGIDIPLVNQVIMLRNTQSSIIFIQQLGRGLRKHPTKDFVTIIDFIGNYHNNYMIPMALSGDHSLNKNSLRKDTFDTDYISGLSAINFEHIAKEKIFESIDSVSLDSMFELKKTYKNLKNRLNRVPFLYDFYEHQLLDPVVLSNKKKTYYYFLEQMDDNTDTLTKQDNNFLLFISRELLTGVRPHDLLALTLLLEDTNSLSKVHLKRILSSYSLSHDDLTIHSIFNTLSMSFYTGGYKKSYQYSAFITDDGHVTTTFKQAKENGYFIKHMTDLLKTGLAISLSQYLNEPFTLYEKYKRRDVLRLLNWEKQMVDQNIGGYTRNDSHFVIFVTLEKGDDFKGALVAYEDTLLDQQTILWFTKASRNLNSPEVVALLASPSQLDIHFFIKKKDDHGSDFYYLGKVYPILETVQQDMTQTSKGHKKSLVKMELRLETPIETKLFKFLTQ